MSNEKEPITSTSPPPSGSFAYQTRLIENSLSRTSSLSRSGSVTKGILSPSTSRKFFTHRSGSSVDSLRLERSRPIPENDVLADVGHPISTSTDVFRDMGLAETPRHSSVLSREPPLTVATPAPLSRWAAPDIVRPQPAGAPRSPSKASPNDSLGDVGRNFAMVSPLNSGEFPIRPNLRTPDNDPGSGSPSTPTTDFKRHRAAGSIDSIRTRWEARAREAEIAEVSTQTTGPLQRRGTASKPAPQDMQRKPLDVPALPSSSLAHDVFDRFEASTPVALKRRTMPDPPAMTSIRDQWESRARSQDDVSELGQLPALRKPDLAHDSSVGGDDTANRHRVPTARRNTFTDTVSPSVASSLNASKSMTSPALVHRVNSPPIQPSHLHGLRERTDHAFKTPSTSADSLSSIGSRMHRSPSVDSTTTSSVDPRMNRLNSSSTNMELKSLPSPSSGASKQNNYAGLGTRTRLGRHLPRIASGDAPDDLASSSTSSPTLTRSSKKYQLPPMSSTPPEAVKARDHKSPTPLHDSHYSPTKANGIIPPVPNASHVPGRADRIQLLKSDSEPSSPSSSFPYGRNWIETQRQFIIAYEYLCHVGEAQQWIEGCLDEELPFGVVEMDEGLRNGVVLARLARVWEGESVVRKIFEVSSESGVLD